VEIFEDYLGKTASEHESKWKSLKDQGYRFLSLSVFGDPIRYSAVLVKRNGPKWEHTTGSINSLKDEIAHYRGKNMLQLLSQLQVQQTMPLMLWYGRRKPKNPNNGL
jgi:hypothetical protein